VVGRNYHNNQFLQPQQVCLGVNCEYFGNKYFGHKFTHHKMGVVNRYRPIMTCGCFVGLLLYEKGGASRASMTAGHMQISVVCP
jgi:hypothetical protein